MFREDLIYFHQLRNDLYYEGRGLVPAEDDIKELRKAALWIFSILFDIDTEKFLQNSLSNSSNLQSAKTGTESKEVYEQINQEPLLSNETSFLRALRQMRVDLNKIINVVSKVELNESEHTGNPKEWQQLLSDPVSNEAELEAIVTQVERLRDAIIHGKIVSQDELKEATHQVQQVSKRIDERLRHYQIELVERAVIATKRAVGLRGPKTAGIVCQPTGSGLTFTMMNYIVQIVEQQIIPQPIVVVVSDRVVLNDQLYNRFQSDKLTDFLQATKIRKSDELSDCIESKRNEVIFTTIHKFTENFYVKSQGANVLVIVLDVRSSGKHMSLLFERLSEATFILFTSSLPAQASDLKNRFGDVVGLYSYMQAVQDGYLLPIHWEQRSLLTSRAFVEEQLEHIDEVELNFSIRRSYFETNEYLHALANDIISHFESRISATDGKALIIVNNRNTAIKLYDLITQIRPNWHSERADKGRIKVLIGKAANDPISFYAHYFGQSDLLTLYQRFAAPEDSLKLIITAGSWITGIEVPVLDTVYICKPMNDYSLHQVIGRITRAAVDKESAVIVDYCGNERVVQGIFDANITADNNIEYFRFNQETIAEQATDPKLADSQVTSRLLQLKKA